jgi:hypothetical protein
MTIIFTTAYKDISRNNWLHYYRTNQSYYTNFCKLANNIEYKLVVYLNDSIKTELFLYNNNFFNDNIIFIDINEVDTFYNKY